MTKERIFSQNVDFYDDNVDDVSRITKVNYQGHCGLNLILADFCRSHLKRLNQAKIVKNRGFSFGFLI